MSASIENREPVPRDPENDYTREAAAMRREFLRERTGAELEHVASFSFDAGVLPGNVEQFIGVAQVPIGVAGPLLVHGEEAQGEFYVPLATAEGTPVASYNRGMKLLYAAGGITAIFIATGQDVANVAESSAALVYAEQRPNGDYYYSVTIPSLIVATYGGGTGLPTQRECLELLGCYGAGKVRKLAEIVAATVLCGELSLGAAIVAEEWVEAHDLLGRNRP